MKNYSNENSGVGGFEFGPNYIVTMFGNKYYLYSEKTTGPNNIEQMKRLAEKGEGLSSFISRNVKFNYEARFDNERDLRKYLESRESLN